MERAPYASRYRLSDRVRTPCPPSRRATCSAIFSAATITMPAARLVPDQRDGEINEAVPRVTSNPITLALHVLRDGNQVWCASTGSSGRPARESLDTIAGQFI